MHCKEYLQLLSGHLDRTNSEKEEKRLQGHLKSCKHCRELLAQMEANDLLINDEAIVPPADLTQRIMARVEKEPRKRVNRRRIISYAAAGLAAAAMFTLVMTGRIPLLSREKVSANLPSDPLSSVSAFYDEAEEYLDKLGEANDVCATEYAPTDSGNDLTAPNGTPTESNAFPPIFTGAADIENDAVTEAPQKIDTPPPTEAVPIPTDAAPEEPSEVSARSTEPVESDIGLPAPVPITGIPGSVPPEDCMLPTEAPTEPTEIVAEPILPDASNERTPPKRGLPHETVGVFPGGPVLVIWDAADASISPYADLEAVELKNLPISSDTALLFPRFMQSLPLAEHSILNNSLPASEPQFSVTAYKTSYETFHSVLLDYVGTYELTVYYPTTDGDYTQGLLLLITKTAS